MGRSEPVDEIRDAGERSTRLWRLGGAASARDVCLALIVAVLTIPVLVPRALTLLDGSWILANSLAGVEKLTWGQDLSFTYGPLGFLRTPVPVSAGVVWVALLFSLASFAGMSFAIARLAAPLGTAQAWSIAFLTASLVGSQDELLAPMLVVVLWTLLWRKGESPIPETLSLPAMGALASAMLLSKFNVGVVLFAWLAFSTLGRGTPSTLRNYLLVALGAGTAFLTLWLLTGQRAGFIAEYLTDSIRIASGYRHAMSTSVASPASAIHLLALYLVGLALALAWNSQGGAALGERSALVMAVLMVVAGAWLQAFTRFDRFHAVLFFATVGPIAVGLAASNGKRTQAWPSLWPWVAYSVAALGLVIARGGGAPASWTMLIHPQISLASAIQSGVVGADKDSRSIVLEELRANFLHQAAVPPEVATYVAGQSVHAEPWAVGAVWALGGRWRPVPVYQTYSAYTTALDVRNRDALLDGPEPSRVLRQNIAIDRRNPLWESPRLQLALVCHFRQVVASGSWSVLERAADRCGETRALGTSPAKADQRIPVPGGPGTVAVEVLDAQGGSNRITVSCNDVPYELAQPTPTGPLIVRIPPSAGWLEGSFPAPCQTVSFDRDVELRWLITPMASVSVDASRQ